MIAGIRGFTLTFAELEALGVKRVSIGSTMARAALTTFAAAARERLAARWPARRAAAP